MKNGHWIHASGCKSVLTSILFISGMGCALAAQESTVFRYDGQDFIRDKSTLMTEDGKSAANTKLDRDSPAYKQLVQKHSYSGLTKVFGQKCDSSYAPVTDSAGKLTGALFVGTCTK